MSAGAPKTRRPARTEPYTRLGDNHESTGEDRLWVGRSPVSGRRARSERDARRRSLSQNFLRSPAIAAELVAEAEILRSELVVEIGAGSGILTRALAASAGSVMAIEVDAALASRLRERFGSDPRVRIVEGDVRSTSLPHDPFRVVASLPFGQMTQILRHLLDDLRTPLTRADVIVQWEAAWKRILVPPRIVLTICWAPWWRFSITHRIPARSFRPVPAVDAAVLAIERRAQPLLPPSQRPRFEALVRAGFHRTQLPLSRALARHASAATVNRALGTVGAYRGATAADLSARQWVDLFGSIRKEVGAT